MLLRVLTEKSPVLGLLLLLSLILIGCASQETEVNYRASELLINSNPAQKIAIVAEAKVMRPRMGGKSAILSLSSSKLLLEDSLPKLKSAFEDKGYEVVYAEPAGVGYYWRGPDDYWVYDFDVKEKGEGLDKWRVETMDPVYEYPEVINNKLINTAARDEFERLNDYISMGRLSVYFPKSENASTIAKTTGADTVCFARLWGKRYSAGRIAGDVAMKVVAAMFGVYSSGGLRELKVVNIACSNVASNSLLWMNSHSVAEDPIGRVGLNSISETDVNQPAVVDGESSEIGVISSDSFFEDAITKLPNAGQSITGKCSMTDRARMVVSCSDSKKSNTVAQSY